MIVFTDLDGTLLDHATYSWSAAEPALAALREHDIPLILASSKTAAEMAPLREELGFAHCEAIVENGAGILEPGEAGSGNTDVYQGILATLASLPDNLRKHYTGFADWSVEEVAEKTGLTVSAAALAKQRQFSEPGLWSGNHEAFEAFSKALGEAGFVIQKGGRFHTISPGANKADRMVEIAKRYRATGNSGKSVALGDAPNDIEMIERADLGIIIPNPAHGGIGILAGDESGTIVRADHDGPKGWNAEILKLLNKTGADT